MGQQGVQLDVEPAVAKPLHKSGRLHPGQDRPVAVSAHSRAVAFTQLSYLQSRAFKLPGGLFQRLLQFVRYYIAVGQRRKDTRLPGGVHHQLLDAVHIVFHRVHVSSFLLARRSVGEVVMASYSFSVAWNWTGTWL